MGMRVKASVADFALFGGKPEFDVPLHVGRPNPGNRDALFRRMNEMLDRNWLTNDGPLVREFEAAVCNVTGAAHCVAVANATLGLQLVSRALGLQGEFIVPSFTFVASVHAFHWQGLTPVFCDIKPGTCHLNADLLDSLCTPRTSAILGVHVWGQGCDVDAILSVARRRGLRVIFDAAHAFGCSHHGVPIGTFGDAEVFSFHATKCVNAFEGGAITTQDAELAKQLKLLRNFGFCGIDDVRSIGINAKMHEASAAMGLTSLESLPVFVERNHQNFRAYLSRLSRLPGISVFVPTDAGHQTLHYVVATIDEKKCGLSRDELVSILAAENVLCRRYFFPGCHRVEPYRSLCPVVDETLPVTNAAVNNVLVLPTGMQVAEPEIARICGVIEDAVTHAREIRSRFSATLSTNV